MDITNDYNQYGDPDSESMLTQDARRATGEEVRPQLSGALNRISKSVNRETLQSERENYFR